MGIAPQMIAPQSDALVATVTMQVQQALATWLADQVHLERVDVLAGSDPSNGLDEGTLLVTVTYTLVETQTLSTVAVQVS